MRQALLFSSFSLWGNWSSERLSNSSKATQRISIQGRIPTQMVWLQPLPSAPTCFLPGHRFVVILAVFHARAPDFLWTLMYMVRVGLGPGCFLKVPHIVRMSTQGCKMLSQGWGWLAAFLHCRRRAWEEGVQRLRPQNLPAPWDAPSSSLPGDQVSFLEQKPTCYSCPTEAATWCALASRLSPQPLSPATIWA